MSSTTDFPVSDKYGGQQQYLSSQDYFIEHYSEMLLNEAEKLYNKLVKDLTKGIIYDAAHSD